MSNPEDYTVGWICAVETEYVAAQVFLDEEYPSLDFQEPNDDNIYCLGRIGRHKIAIACLPNWDYGLVSAANVARDMLRTFTNLRFGLMVGIGGGVPMPNDIRLGDVVVSSINYEEGAVFQYDFGQTIQGQAFKTTGHLDKPPRLLSAAVINLRARYKKSGNKIGDAIAAVLDQNLRLENEYCRPDPTTDRLYRSEYIHSGESRANCASTCGIDDANIVTRQPRTELEDNPKVHYGLIASSNQLMQNAEIRDRLAEEKGVLCFEMEAAGLMNHFRCLVIRGICDYSDSHKNSEWQGFAAMAAAAYAKDLLNLIPPSKVLAEEKLELSKIMKNIDLVVSDTQHRVQHLQEDAHVDRIRKWLSPSDPSTNFNIALSLRHQGTGEWFIKSQSYSTWKSKNNSFLWLYGMPGCGKTVLTSSILNDLKQDTKCSPGLVYFYFSFSDTSKQYLEGAVRSLVYQLYRVSEATRQCLNSLYDTFGTSRQQPSLSTLCATFTTMVQKAGEVWIILDALDECSMRNAQRSEDLLSWIQSLQNSQLNIHLLVTSRPEHDIKSAIKSFSHSQERISLQSNLIEDDIRSYIETTVKKNSGLERWQSRPDVQREIEAALIKKADGMFRWVYCQLEILKDFTLDDTYKRILNNIPQIYRNQAMRLLQFLLYSERPLLIDEAVDALAIDLKRNPPFDEEDRMPFPEEITKYCSSLVTIVTTEDIDHGAYESDFDSDVTVEIQLAPYSVKEYLTSDRLKIRDELLASLREACARKSLAEICVSYLLQAGKGRKSYPIEHYAAEYWTQHAIAAGCDGSKLIMNFLTCKKAFERFCYIYYPRIASVFMPTALYYVSSMGLVRCAQNLIRLGADVNGETEPFGTPLQVAASKGHESLVRLLLKKGANVNVESRRDSTVRHHTTALHAAAIGGYHVIVQMLLNKGAKINAKNYPYGTALKAAAGKGHETIVRLLIDQGANINAKSGSDGTALYAAASGGHETVVSLLLNKGANIDAGAGSDGTALHAAASEGHEIVARLLLDKGADINAEAYPYGTALHAAASEGHEAVARLLLDRGADVNRVNSLGQTVLEYVTRRGDLAHQPIVRMLLERGARPQCKVQGHGSALSPDVVRPNGRGEIIAGGYSKRGARRSRKRRRSEDAEISGGKLSKRQRS
ncbi:hypothetical protein F4777DRAFT_576118 [Nemania sp. FL0916]|nr:hypothetical protein F4777DRAFT_576118 [Nemania sp. FL0916]